MIIVVIDERKDKKRNEERMKRLHQMVKITYSQQNNWRSQQQTAKQITIAADKMSVISEVSENQEESSKNTIKSEPISQQLSDSSRYISERSSTDP